VFVSSVSSGYLRLWQHYKFRFQSLFICVSVPQWFDPWLHALRSWVRSSKQPPF
jgi:hypothetical protein